MEDGIKVDGPGILRLALIVAIIVVAAFWCWSMRTADAYIVPSGAHAGIEYMGRSDDGPFPVWKYFDYDNDVVCYTKRWSSSSTCFFQ